MLASSFDVVLPYLGPFGGNESWPKAMVEGIERSMGDKRGI